jgi:hypothetical protein
MVQCCPWIAVHLLRVPGRWTDDGQPAFPGSPPPPQSTRIATIVPVACIINRLCRQTSTRKAHRARSSRCLWKEQAAASSTLSSTVAEFKILRFCSCAYCMPGISYPSQAPTPLRADLIRSPPFPPLLLAAQPSTLVTRALPCLAIVAIRTLCCCLVHFSNYSTN